MNRDDLLAAAQYVLQKAAVFAAAQRDSRAVLVRVHEAQCSDVPDHVVLALDGEVRRANVANRVAWTVLEGALSQLRDAIDEIVPVIPFRQPNATEPTTEPTTPPNPAGAA